MILASSRIGAMKRSRKPWLALLAVVGALLAASLWWAMARIDSFDQLLRYQADRDYRYDLKDTQARRVTVQLTPEGFIWPSLTAAWDTAFLRFSLQTNLAGRLVDPYLEMAWRSVKSRQYFERGAGGVRYLNLSQLAAGPPAAGDQVSLKGVNLHWQGQKATLVLFANPPVDHARILVVAPHPDDAEIAAFGLYSHRDAYVVTITAGEAGDAFPEPGKERDTDLMRLHLIKGRLRVWDSLAVPLWGGLGPDRSLNLGYFDSSLGQMYRAPLAEIASLTIPQADLSAFRQSEGWPLRHKRRGRPSWRDLVSDLRQVLRHVRPQVIVTPHPWLDEHPDHHYATLAVLQALREEGLIEGSLYLYTNHHVLSEVYPFGEAGSLVTLPPWMDGGWLFTSVYSHPLDHARQVDKYFALEAMHDLRYWYGDQTTSLDFLGAGLRRARQEMMDVKGARSYFRRAVRVNELFFVVPVSQAERLLVRPRPARRCVRD